MTNEIIPLIRRYAKPLIIGAMTFVVALVFAALHFDSIQLFLSWDSVVFDVKAEKYR